MNAKINRPLSLFAAGLCALLGSAVASGDAIQTLDRVQVHNTANVLEMQFNNPARAFDFAVLGITPATSSGFRAVRCVS